MQKNKSKSFEQYIKNQNPNDSIYFLMKIFFCIIKGFEKEQKKKNVEWEYIRKNLTYKSIISYLSFI